MTLVVEGFAGPGGWSEGLRLAGYRGRSVGLEHDMPACRTAMASGHTRICTDVATYPPAAFGDVDGLIQSPPCQAWSMAGDRKGEVDREAVFARITAFARGRDPEVREWADPRSHLTAEPMRYVVALWPRWVALEQVPAVLPLWEHMAALLRELGYKAWAGILSAERYGVPQTRKRAILIARRDGVPVGPPEPTHQPYRPGDEFPDDMPDLFGPALPPPVSMAQALGWPDSWSVEYQRGKGMAARHGDRPHRPAPAPAPTIRAGSGGVGTNLLVHRTALRNGNQANACTRTLDEPAGTLFFGQRTNAVDWVVPRMHPAGVHGSYGYSRPVDEPSPTIKGAGSGGQYVSDGEQTVRITVTEAAILQGFRPDYPWQGTKSAQYRQVGDAVPPPLAAAILRPLLGGAA